MLWPSLPPLLLWQCSQTCPPDTVTGESSSFRSGPSSRSTSLSLSIPSFTVCHSISDISPSVNMNHRFFQASKNRLHSIFAPSPKIFAEILNPVPRGAVPTIHVHHAHFMSSLALEPSESLPVCPLPAPASKCCWSLIAPVGYSPFLP